MTSCCDSSYSGLPFLCAGMPVRIPEVRLAEPAVTPFAILGGRNHARLIPERNALAEYRGRLTFLFSHEDALQWLLFIDASRGTCRTVSVAGMLLKTT